MSTLRFQRFLLVVLCGITLLLATQLTRDAAVAQQSSPLSPLASQTLSSTAPVSDDEQVPASDAPAAAELPLGEPFAAPGNVYLVGGTLLGLIALATLLIIRR